MATRDVVRGQKKSGSRPGSPTLTLGGSVMARMRHLHVARCWGKRHDPRRHAPLPQARNAEIDAERWGGALIIETLLAGILARAGAPDWKGLR